MLASLTVAIFVKMGTSKLARRVLVLLPRDDIAERKLREFSSFLLAPYDKLFFGIIGEFLLSRVSPVFSFFGNKIFA